MMRILIVVILAVFSVGGLAVGSPLVTLTGPDSEAASARYLLARSQDVFDKYWKQHEGNRGRVHSTSPRIDFESCDAIFIFGGERKNSDGYRVVETIEADESLTIRFELMTYQTASLDGRDSGNDVRPWALLILPRTSKTIILEQNVQSLIRGDPVWKHRMAFPGRTAG